MSSHIYQRHGWYIADRVKVKAEEKAKEKTK